jgi:hypothetical protein
MYQDYQVPMADYRMVETQIIGTILNSKRTNFEVRDPGWNFHQFL